MTKHKLKQKRIELMSKMIKTDNENEKKKIRERLEQINIKLRGKNGN